MPDVMPGIIASIMKKYLLKIALLLVLIGLGYFAVRGYRNNNVTTSTTTTDFTCVGENGGLTDGIQLNEPIPVVWEAKLDECLITGCHGASFTKKISDEVAGEYPHFIGYYKDTDIPQQFLKKDIDLKISGNWEFLYTDKDAPSIHNRCVPLVKIDRIEQL